MIILSSQKKIFLILFISLIILAILSWFVVLPLINKVKTISQEYLSNQETFLRLSKKGLTIKDLKKNYQQSQPDLSKIEGAFLPSEEVVGFISTLETIAGQTNNIFEIQLARPLAQEKIGEASSLDFRISLWGGFNDLLRFIAYLENNPFPPYRLIGLESLTIQRLTEQRLAALSPSLEIGDIQGILSIKVYTR